MQIIKRFTALQVAIRHGFYPLSLCATLLFIFAEVRGWLGPLGKAYPIYLAILIGLMLVLEQRLPLQTRWGMSRRSFLVRDLPMLVFNGTTIAATSAAVTWLARHSGWNAGATASLLPWWLQAIVAILISDFLWYWVHRYSHEGRSALGRWLWKTHVMHHLPQEVYVFMHVAGHPINSAYVRLILMLPPIVLGFSPEAVFAASVLTGFQGLLSHFNVDARAGWLNRLFMGTELHRYHHSADVTEAKNYAAVVSLWDQCFGTYVYHPGRAPRQLGVADRDAYPPDRAWFGLLFIPFVGAKR